MREILFKAKRLDNGEWISGSLVCFAGSARAILPSDSKTLFSKSKGFICCDTCHDVDPSTVCQYTGLKDKNGKRIFEGDNVYDPHENSIYTVEWNENNAIFQMAHDWRRRSIETAYYCEIIGNIYDGEGGRHERSPEVRMKCNKDCIANVCGECAVEKCEGQIQRLGIRNNNAETAAWTYKIAVDSFKDYFGKKDADQ